MATLLRRSACLPLILLALVASAKAQDEAPVEDPRIDAATGRQMANWAPARPFDHLHMRLELDIPDLEKPELTGVLTLRAAAIGVTRSVLPMDCKGPEVDEVTVGSDTCTFEQAGGVLAIHLPQPVAPGQEVEVVVRYSLDFSKQKGEGLTWSKPRPDSDSPTLQAPQIHAQGETEYNSTWFPCHDSPNERLTSELIVTIPDSGDEFPYEVISNGRLISKEAVAEGRTRWHWLQDKPHAPYLVTLAIGKFAVVELGGPDSARPGLPIPVYTTRGTEDNVRETFKETPAMIAFFEKVFGEPYPWDKYAQVIVRDFAAGGMENTSATLLTISTARAKPGTQDDLISHELAHQWTGDLLTCKTWEHLWLNEGWATYAEALWAEHKAGDPARGGTPDAAKKAYQRIIVQSARGIRGRSRGAYPQYTAMVSNRYRSPETVFMKADNPYGKGATILHMLRMRVGDTAFFDGMRRYVQKYKFKAVETDDFRREMEAASGQSLQEFFDQWARRPGVVRLAADYHWHDSSHQLQIAMEQTQTIDRLNPPYTFDLPVVVTLKDGTTKSLVVPVTSQSAEIRVDLPSMPEKIQVDPDLAVLAALTVRTPLPETAAAATSEDSGNSN